MFLTRFLRCTKNVGSAKMHKIIYTKKRLVITRDGLLPNLIKFIKYQSTDFLLSVSVLLSRTVGTETVLCTNSSRQKYQSLIQTKKEEESTFV